LHFRLSGSAHTLINKRQVESGGCKIRFCGQRTAELVNGFALALVASTLHVRNTKIVVQFRRGAGLLFRGFEVRDGAIEISLD
jgi:hypothetical protein